MTMVDAFMADLLADLERDEGKRNKPYLDTEGHLTIGIGRNLDALGVSDDEIELMLLNDLKWVLHALDRNLPWWRDMPGHHQRALANMCFNLGYPRLSGFKNMLAALQVGNGEDAATEALDSRWARQVGARAERIATLYRSA